MVMAILKGFVVSLTLNIEACLLCEKQNYVFQAVCYVSYTEHHVKRVSEDAGS